MADLGTLVARIGLDTTPLAAGAAAAKGELAGLESSGSNSLNKLASVGKAAFVGLSVAGAAVSVVSLKMASDFQQSMELVRTQAGASQAEVDSMTKSVLDMAAAVGTSPQALADALFHIESAGLRGAEALDVLKIAAMGAKIGNADLESVTNALVAVTTSHIGGVHTQAEAMGVLNAIIGVGNMRMDDLAKAIGTGILPVAKSFGLSLQDVGAAMAVLTDQAVPAEVAATRLRTTFALLAAPTAEAVKQLQRIGISSTDLAEAMRHGGIVEAIGLLRDKLAASGLSATEAAQLLNKAFGGGETSGTILTLIGNFDSLVAKQKGIAEGATKFAESWEATKQTFAFQMDQMKASAEVLGIKIGNFLIPIVVDLVKALDSAVTWLGKHKDVAAALAAVVGGPLLVAMAAFVATEIAAAAPVLAVGLAIGALSAAFVYAYEKIGPFHDAVNAVGNFLKSTFLTVVDNARKAWEGFIAGFENPEQKIKVGGIQGLFQSLGSSLKTIFDDIKLGWDLFLLGFANSDQKMDLGGIQGKIVGFGQTVKNIFDGLVSGIGTAFGFVQGYLNDFVGWLRDIAPQAQEAVTHIVNVIRDVLSGIGQVFTAVFNTIKLAWQTWGDDITRIVRNVFDTVKAYVDTGIRIVRDVIQAVLALINGDWGKAWDAISDIPKAALGLARTVVENGLKLVGNAISGVVDTFWQLVQKAWDKVLGAFGTAIDAVLQFFKDLPGRAVDALKNLGELLLKAIVGAILAIPAALALQAAGIYLFFKELVPKAVGFVIDKVPELIGLGRKMIDGLWQGIQAAWDIVLNFFRDLPGNVVKFFDGALDWLRDVGRKIIDGLWQGIQAAWDAVLNFFRGFPGNIVDFFSGALDWLRDIGGKIIDGLWQGIQKVWDTVLFWFRQLPSGIQDFFKDAGRWLLDAGGKILGGLWDGIVAVWNGIKGFFQGLPGEIGGFFSAVGGWLVDAGSKLLGGLWDGIVAVWNGVKGFFQGLPGEIGSFFSGAIGWLVDAGSKVLRGLWDGIVSVWNAVKGFFQGLPGEIGDFFSGALSWLLDAGDKVIRGLWDGIVGMWNAVKGFFQRLPTEIGNFFFGAVTWLYNAGIDLMTGYLNGIIKAMELLPGIVRRFLGLDVVLQGLKAAVDKLQGSKIEIVAHADTAQAESAMTRLLESLGKLDVAHFRPYKPPPFASGGLVARPTVGLVGEAGPELILPLSEPQRARSLLSQHGGSIGMGGDGAMSQSSVTNYNINGPVLAADPMELERQLEARARVARMSGAM